MHPAFLQQLFSDEIIRAICWTLVHSLWQGLLLAIVCGIVIIATRKSSSAIRYNILSGLFFLFMLTAGFTFNRELHLAEKNDSSIKVLPVEGLVVTNNETQHISTSSFVTTGQTYLEEIVFYFNTHASLVVAIWFIIFSARCVRLLADLGYAQRIRYYKTHLPSSEWQSKLQELADRLQIKKHIILLESEIVKVPMMTGFIKPIILFPFSMVTQLSTEQIEAVLLHELAHIKRKDYFVNLIQSFGEIIFFFNPAVLWISSLIREERENCCDDTAIYHTKNKKEFIHALVAFQELNMDNSKYAMAFPGKKNQLLQRVKRIIYNDNKTLNIMQKIFLVSGLVIACLLTVFAQSKKPTPVKPVSVSVAPPPPAKLERNIPSVDYVVAAVPDAPVPIPPVPEVHVTLTRTDTLPSSAREEPVTQGIFDKTVNGKRYEIVIMKNRITELYINGKRIPDNKISTYKSTTDKIVKEIKEESAKATVEVKEAREQANLAKVEAEESAKQAYETKVQAETARKQADQARQQSQEVNVQSQANEKYAAEAREQAEVSKKQAEASREQAEKAKMQSEKLINDIIADLKKDGIIKNEKDVSFSLNKNDFIVNGIRQPNATRDKYKEKYSPEKNSGIEYSKASNSIHISIQDGK